MAEQTLDRQLTLINQQITETNQMYQALLSKERGYRSEIDIYGEARLGVVPNWIPETLALEKQLFKRFDELEAAKTRLITGEKAPDVVFVDREVPKIVEKEVISVVEQEVIKYITTKNVNVSKPALIVAAFWTLVLAHTVGVAAWYYGLIDVVVKTNF